MNKTTEALNRVLSYVEQTAQFIPHDLDDEGIAVAAILREALAAQDHIADAGKVIPQFIPVGIVNDHHSIDWMEEIVEDQAPIGAILYALQDSVGRNVSFVDESVCNWRQPTYGDMAKADDKLYRSLVERRQKDRWKTGITTDGYALTIPNAAPQPVQSTFDKPIAPEITLPKQGKCECGDKSFPIFSGDREYCKTCGWPIYTFDEHRARLLEEQK